MTISKYSRPAPPPLDAMTLDAMALRYVERYATSQARLKRYLERKLRERGWADERPADVAAVVGRLAEQRYVDDSAFAGMRARALSRRGMGGRRIGAALAADGIHEDIRSEARDELDDWEAALTLARRKRLGPFGQTPKDALLARKLRDRAIGQFLRAGHRMDVARAILDAVDENALARPE